MGLKFWSMLLLAAQLILLPQSSSAFGGLFGGGHGGGRSEVAEILAAGIITKLLMEEYAPRPSVMHALSHGMMGGYGLELPRPSMHSLMIPRMPMMHPYAMSPMVHHHPNIYIQQATLMHQARKQALESSLKEELRALEASESFLEAYLASNGEGETSTLEELLSSEDDSLPAAALLLEAAELSDQEETLTAKTDVTVPEVIETAGSETESRYILPRIARYFVQRLLRRAENH